MLAHRPDRDQKAAIKMDLEIPADQEELKHMWLVNFKKEKKLFW